MGSKRKACHLGIGRGDDSDAADDDNVDLALGPDSCGPDDNVFLTDYDCFGSGDKFSLSHDPVSKALYDEYMEECRKVTLLKEKLLRSLSHKSDGKAKVGVSSFSISTFSNVIDSLSEDRKDVIRRYGFGSLLLFEKCSVPRNFVDWVARLVNFNSGDMVVDGKVISLTKEAVHLVLDLPFGGLSFPEDYSAAKLSLLSRFGLDSVPCIDYFCESLTSKKEMSDDDMFVCFIVAAMSTFLCPNCSVIPSQKYFGIFEDLGKIRSFDWCGYILACLLDSIKTFNQFKGCKSSQHFTLGGCLYFLAVVYLDHVDFGCHQVPSPIPRISVWKQGMIQQYARLDMKPDGSFGYHPIMDYSRTCYAKDMRLLPQILNQSVDGDFQVKLESYARCKLPPELKAAICKLIENHCLNCGVSVNFDVNSITALSDEMRLTFIKLWKHVYSVSKMSQRLVLEVIRLLSDSVQKDDDFGAVSDSPVIPVVDHSAPILAGSSGFDKEYPSGFACKTNAKLRQDTGLQYGPRNESEENANHGKKAARFSPSNLAASRNVLGDISNSMSLRRGRVSKSKSVSVDTSPVVEVYDVDNDNLYVPDSLSPSMMPAGYRRFFSHKVENKSGTSSKNLGLHSSKLKEGLPMQSLDFSDISMRGIQAVHSNKAHFSDASLPSSSRKAIESPDVLIVGEKSFARSLGELTKEANAIYNSQLNLGGFSRTFRNHDSHQNTSRIGSVQHDMHTVNAGSSINASVALPKSKFYEVNKSNFKTYTVLCKLSSSQFQNEDAVCLSNVRCNFWCLGESLKPGGFVKSYVVSCLCYSLFLKLQGHPYQFKKLYFFPNVGDNLLLNFVDCDHDVLKRAFSRSSKSKSLSKSHVLYFPMQHDSHWFLFVVDIKNHLFIFLDSLYDRNSDFFKDVEGRVIHSFLTHWEQFVEVGMHFNSYEISYPTVPKQSLDKPYDSGIFTMLFLELWKSPSDILCNFFSAEDIPSIRIKFANDLFFHPKNSGMKMRVLDFNDEE